MKELETRYLSEVGGGLNGAACEADALGGFGIGATVGGSIGLAAGPAGGAIGAALGGLVGGSVAVSDNANCGTADGSAAAASAASASTSCSAATSCCADSGDSGGGGGGGGKVICTELCRAGEIDHEVWLADIRYSRQNFSERTMRGYHLWGVPYVRWMRRYSPLRRATEEQIVLAAKQQSTFLESVRGIQAIKLFGRESQRLAVWQNRLVDTTNRVLKTQRFMIGYRLALGLLGAVESILVVWIGAQLILGGVFSIGMLFAFVAYKGVFSARMSSLIDKAVELRMLRLQGERLADIVLTSREANGEPEGMGDTSLPSLCLDAVSFRYSELDLWVLRETRLTIPAGAAVAIVGPSGCGKTTLAKLLLGLLRPTAGRIAVQGRERSLSDAGHLRYITGAVMQDDHLFTGSLADNIAFFDPRPDLEKIERVARLACIHDDIRHMAMGYHTLVGDMGTALSGGQRQRILLARALYREPKILVLDEATSHLDVALERAINDAVRGLKMTRIVIAHRPETIAACDLVVELPSVNQVEPPALAAP